MTVINNIIRAMNTAIVTRRFLEKQYIFMKPSPPFAIFYEKKDF